MAYKIKGEAEVQLGFGLPRHTTASLSNYIPPYAGYQVYNTDVEGIFTYDATLGDWIKSLIPVDLNGLRDTTEGLLSDKYDKTGGTISGDVNVQGYIISNSDNAGLLINRPTANGNAEIVFQRGGVIRGGIFSTAASQLIRRHNSAGAVVNSVNLYDDYTDFSTRISVTGNADITGNLSATGDADITGDLGVTGDANIASDLNVTKNADM